MKKIIFYISIVSSAVAVHSCSRDFEEINTNTSKLSNPSVGSLLVPIQYEMATYGYPVSYTHLDVYKRQVLLSYKGEVNKFSISASAGGSIRSVSYTHLDVYKRQLLLLPLRERPPPKKLPNKSSPKTSPN